MLLNTFWKTGLIYNVKTHCKKINSSFELQQVPIFQNITYAPENAKPTLISFSVNWNTEDILPFPTSKTKSPGISFSSYPSPQPPPGQGASYLTVSVICRGFIKLLSQVETDLRVLECALSPDHHLAPLLTDDYCGFCHISHLPSGKAHTWNSKGKQCRQQQLPKQLPKQKTAFLVWNPGPRVYFSWEHV